jgi:hypothetical protein
MDRAGRSDSDWQTVNALLLRQFLARSLAALLLIGPLLVLAAPDLRLAFGALIGGGWMAANCLALTWMGARALQHGQGRASGRYVLGFIAALLGLLALGGWLVFILRPMRAGLTVGFSIPLAVFLLQLRRLKLTLRPHAR